MNSEMELQSEGKTIRVYLQDGFFACGKITQTLHRHLYTELHLLAAGEAVMERGKERVTLHAGEGLTVTAGEFHRCVRQSDDARHMAFQFDAESAVTGIIRTEQAATAEFRLAVERYRTGGDGRALAAYLILLLDRVLPAKAQGRPPEITDRRFLICEYFSRNYNREATLGELAALLHLGEKQTEREVTAVMGEGFRRVIERRRMEAAESLLEDGKISMREVAETIGYKSYSGFWKAWNRHIGKSKSEM